MRSQIGPIEVYAQERCIAGPKGDVAQLTIGEWDAIRGLKPRGNCAAVQRASARRKLAAIGVALRERRVYELCLPEDEG